MQLHFCLLAQQPKESLVVSGTVYDITARNPIEAVTIHSNKGAKGFTDSLGKYSINVKQNDTIWFSMLGKATPKYPVDTIRNLDAFDISILLKSSSLPEVKVRNKNYRLDSLSNRQEYAKIFNFKKPSLSLLSTNRSSYLPGQVSVGLDLQEIINMFRFKRNKSLETLQRRLLQQEQDKYIEYRFSKQFVRKLTKLQGAELDSFMRVYKPNFEFLQTLNDIELGYFIQRDFEEYKQNKIREAEERKKATQLKNIKTLKS